MEPPCKDYIWIVHKVWVGVTYLTWVGAKCLGSNWVFLRGTIIPHNLLGQESSSSSRSILFPVLYLLTPVYLVFHVVPWETCNKHMSIASNEFLVIVVDVIFFLWGAFYTPSYLYGLFCLWRCNKYLQCVSWDTWCMHLLHLWLPFVKPPKET